METDISEKITERYRSSSVLIISLLAVFMLAVGILLLAIIIPKNGFETETDESGESASHLYFYDKKLTGWQVVNGTLRYFSPDDGRMLLGKQIIDGKEYYFIPPSGQLAVSRTITFDDGTKITYDYKGNPKAETSPGIFTAEDGTTALNGTNGKLGGWHEVDGIKYYFQPRTGRMLKNERAFIDGKYYDFDENGIAAEVG